MSQKSWENSQKRWEGRLNAIIQTADLSEEAARGLRILAWPLDASARVKQRIEVAARRAGLSYWRAFDLWYRKARQILAQEIEAIRAALRQVEHARQLENIDGLERLAGDLEALAGRVSALGPRAGRGEAQRLRDLAERARHLAEGNRQL